MELLRDIYLNLFEIKDGAKSYLSDKGSLHSYIDFYEKIFEQYRSEKISLLEIGIDKGGSLLLWKKYFENSEVIAGADKEIPTEVRQRLDENKCIGYKLDASNTESDAIQGKFDIIIDDASHIPPEQIEIFKHNIKRLKEDGIYIIEDVPKLDRDKAKYEELAKQYGFIMEIMDLREVNNRFDDVLIVYSKNGVINKAPVAKPQRTEKW